MKFRFQDFRIWNEAIEISESLFDICENLDEKKLYKFADQLRGAALSISNNIAEGSGSNSDKEFIQFLNIARRSAYENANIVIVLNRRKLLTNERSKILLEKIDLLCKQITSFQKSLSAKKN